jgi:hypothetical protein
MTNGPDQERSILPPPDPPFRGEINVAFTDSKADFPEPLRAPEGAPNVLVIVGDDIGYGHMGAFGGPARTPTFDRLSEQGLKYSNYESRPSARRRVPACSPGATPIPSAWA